MVEMVTINVGDLVVALFVAYGAAVVTLVYGFLHATARRQRQSRDGQHGHGALR
jgi:hypothetical protein